MTRFDRRSARVALALWIAWAVVVWNVVFDHTIEVAGRAYLHAAAVADQSGGPYARIDDWMRPAVTRGIWTASAAAIGILAVGLTGCWFAARTR
jgi:hypothetical protein